MCTLYNYVVPGLNSTLLKEHSDGSKSRRFTSTRNQVDAIVPHSHRYNLFNIVERGTVINRIWYRDDRNGDLFREIQQYYLGAPGEYRISPKGTAKYSFEDATYKEGDTYYLHNEQIHSIYFSKGASVLVQESIEVSDWSVFLQPVENGETLDTFNLKPWMFQKRTIDNERAIS